MKLVFKKNEKAEISVFLNIDGHEHEFSYVDMIKDLLESKRMEEPDILDGFSDSEKASINRMVDFINKQIDETDEAKSKEDKCTTM